MFTFAPTPALSRRRENVLPLLVVLVLPLLVMLIMIMVTMVTTSLPVG